MFFILEYYDDKALSYFLGNNVGWDIGFLHNNYLITPLEYAVNTRDIIKVSILINAGAKLDQGIHSHPLLLIALKNLDERMLNYLIQFNNFNNPDQDGIDINLHDSEFFWPFDYFSSMPKEMRHKLYSLFDKRIYKKCSPQDELSKAATLGRIS